MKIFKAILILSILPAFMHGQDIRDKLSPEEKVYGLSKIWAEVNNNFVFLDKLDFDFDSLYMETIPKVLNAKDNLEYISILRTFMSRLGDGHTGLMQSQDYWNSGDYPPVFIELVDDKFLVKSISEEYVEMIPLGSELLRADLIPYVDFKKVSPSGNLFSYVNSTVLLEFKVPNGDIIEKAFIRNFNHKHRTNNPIKMIEKEDNQSNTNWSEYKYLEHDGFSVVEINTFESDIVVNKFQEDITRINSTSGLILDVRENGGGNSEYSKGVAQHLVERDFLVGPMWKTRINNGAKKAWGSMAIFGFEDEWTVSNASFWKNDAWEVNQPDTSYIEPNIQKIDVPIVILTGENTFSAAEDFLIYTLGNQNITKIGQNSAGSSGQPLLITLPGGISARICSKRDALPNGDDYIGIGIEPDIKTDRGIDQVEYAISHIKNN